MKCYELEDSDLLAAGLPGLAPLVMVAHTEKTGPELAAAVRRLVDAQVPDLGAQANLLAVCQVFGELRYNDPRVFEILGGRRMALQSAWMREVWEDETARVVEQKVAAAATAAEARGKAEGKAEFLVRVLHARFAGVTRELEARVYGIENDTLLDELLDTALRSRRLEPFVRQLPQ